MEAQFHLDMNGFGGQTGLMWKEPNGNKGKIMTTYNSYSNFYSKEEKGYGEALEVTWRQWTLFFVSLFLLCFV